MLPRFERALTAAWRDLREKRPSTGANIDALDGVRGLAMLIVLASHTGAFGMRGHGVAGLWLFFALSAFLLTLPFARAPERALQPGAVAHYFSRRARRILPPYYLLVGAWVLYAGLPASLFVRHALFLQGDVHLWSIPQEVLFYFVLPVVLAAHAGLLRGRIPASLVAIVAAMLAANLFLDESVVRLRSSGTWRPFYLGLFLAGVAASLAFHWAPLAGALRRPAWARAVHGTGFALLVLFLATPPAVVAVAKNLVPALEGAPGNLAATLPGTYGVAAAAVIFAAMASPERALGRFFRWTPLRAVGIVSYSFYLTHVAVLRALERRGLHDGTLLFCATLVVGYVLSSLLYGFVERPFLVTHRKRT